MAMLPFAEPLGQVATLLRVVRVCKENGRPNAEVHSFNSTQPMLSTMGLSM